MDLISPAPLVQHLSPSQNGIQDFSWDEVLEKFGHPDLPRQRFILSRPMQKPDSGRDACLVAAVYRMNDAGYINKNLEAINENLPDGSYLLGCFESFRARRVRKKIYSLPLLRHLVLVWEFVFLRALPRIGGINRVYFFFSKGKDRLLSKAEMLGRLVCCGFEIVDYRPHGGLIWFLVRKSGSPAYDHNASYGPVFAMPRIGKNGKIIHVYKLRTMHPYSEYLHDYVVRRHGYAQTGKPAEDFRLTPWGKVFRKYWLDEIPQLLNLLKGDLKLVGVRPVGKRYFEDIPADLRALRLKQKPGCIPPYVALNMKSDVQSVQEAERIYLKDRELRPWSTDLRYFLMALSNIIMRKKRSA
jgi:lipopolysaccharide/colanic/teichoic acid biosynthesis glycosyltransferase